MENDLIIQKKDMTFEQYLEFLDEFWELFGPIPIPPPKKDYPDIKL